MKLKITRFLATMVFAITVGACGGGGGGGGDSGGAQLDSQGFDGTAIMTADLSGAARARPNASMGALEAN